MSAEDLLSLLSQVFFLLLGFITTLDFIRRRGPIRRDIALMFGSIAIPMAASVVSAVSNWPDWVESLSNLSLTAQPYLLIRLVQYLQPVPRWLGRFAFGGMITCFIIYVIFLIFSSTLLQLPGPLALIYLFIVVYFVILNGYAGVAFIRGALVALGVVQQRLRFAAIGSGMVALIFGIAGLVAFFPVLQSIGPILFPLLAVISVLSFYIGFAPPRWLRKMWQFTEFQHFITQVGQKSLNDLSGGVKLQSQLCASANQAVGGLVSMVFEGNEANNGWQSAYSSSSYTINLVGSADESVINQTWRNGTSLMIQNSADLGPANRYLLDAVQQLGLY